MGQDKELERLLSLLDDEDDNVGIPVLASLLERHLELLPHLAELQDSSDPVIRKRVHQLQSILTVRERRYSLLEKISCGKYSFHELMLELHLQWFDCDAPDEIMKLFYDFEKKFCRAGVTTLEELSQFMLSEGICADVDSALDPELYCMGPALTNGHIAESLVCGLLASLLADQGVSAARCGSGFVLTDGKKVLVPHDLWMVSGIKDRKLVPWGSSQILKFALTMIFSYSVSQDHFRYIYTVGQALTGSCDDSFLSDLPYPYRHLPEEVYEQQDRARESAN
ncbi:MAG: hypothetical protein IKD29_00840 [Lentisphaeria bacterium]|nr:hypothetical protein [Lentisphaeria bacterium]